MMIGSKNELDMFISFCTYCKFMAIEWSHAVVYIFAE